jgi:hypothetical protein
MLAAGMQLTSGAQPVETLPHDVPADGAAKQELVKAIKQYMALPATEVRAHPSAADFPGRVPANSPRVSRTLTFSDARGRWQSTGLYADAGEIVTVKPLTALPDGAKVEIRIGCHTDQLFSGRITSWKRFPLVARGFPLTAEPTLVANAFGGQIFVVVNTPVTNSSFRVSFSNAVEAPYFVLGESTVEHWKAIRNAPAPWAELVGRNMILHVPASQIREMDDPAPLLEWWDNVVAQQDRLVGWPARTLQERVVPDRQISAGGMHSGYPFMCHLTSAPLITDLGRLRTNGSWGFFHELGHNHQSSAWTFSGQGEVTVNFFSLYCMEKIVGKPRGNGLRGIDGEALFHLLDKRFADPPDLGPIEQLSAFIVLLHQYGWEPLQQTLASYQVSPIPATCSIEMKQAEFVRRYSRYAQANLTAYFKLMGYSCPEELGKELEDLPGFDYAAWRKAESNARRLTDGQKDAKGEIK